MDDRIPETCGFDCPFARFPPADTAGLCQTMSAVWCEKLSELVNKNLRCEWRRREESRSRAALRSRPAARRRRGRR